jgi:hypothetical protein
VPQVGTAGAPHLVRGVREQLLVVVVVVVKAQVQERLCDTDYPEEPCAGCTPAA